MKSKIYIPSISRFVKWIKLTKDWPKVILLKLGLVQGDLYLKLRNGLSLKLINKGVNSDTSILSDLYFNKPYEDQKFNIKEGDIIVDIGANVGIFSTYITTKGKNVKIFSYEPNKKNFKYLKDNVERNNLQGKIKIFNLAVTDKPGKVNLYLHDRGSGGHSIYKGIAKSKAHTFTEVNSISLKDILTKNKINKIDFLKLDCEGAEYKILFSAPKKTLKKVKKISAETHKIGGLSWKDLKEFLEKKEFNVKIKKSMLWAQRR